MARFFLNPDQVRIMLVEPTVSLRSCMIDALKGCGFRSITGFSDCSDLLEVLETEPVDWIIVPTLGDAEVNAVHLLKLFIEVPRFRNTRVSLMVKEGEAHVLPLAFELGALSFHNRSLPAKMIDEFQGLLRILRDNDYRALLTSGSYLRKHLRSGRHFAPLLSLERSLLELTPGSSDLLLSLAEAQLLSGERADAMASLSQAKLLNARCADRADQVLAEYEPTTVSDGDLENFGEEPQPARQERINTLGLECCMVIDPDTAVQHAIKQLLTDAGVPQVETFGCGEAAWEWIEHRGRPDLVIQEWRLPGLAGPLFLQRARAKLVGVPVILVSSLVSDDDSILVRELGVAATIEKPFDGTTFFSKVVWTIQQHRSPTEQESLERKIVQLLQLGNVAQAQRLRATYLGNTAVSEAGRLRISAEFAFHENDFVRARDLAVKALKMSKESLELLGLLGKALMKLGDFDSALRCLQKADAISPRNVERLCRIATASLESGNVAQAESALGTAKALDADSTVVRETDGAMALSLGDTERAKTAMAGLDSLSRIMAFMNNKAVALVRCGRFEEGIALYQCALASLPGSWSHTHDVVCYNLALAYIRYSELPQAARELGRVQADQLTGLGRKVKALAQKVAHAEKSGAPLALTGFARPEPPVAAPAPDAASEESFESVLASIAPGRGDICCYRVFFAGPLLSRESLELLKNQPKFRERSAIKRKEAMQLKPGAAA